MKAIKELTSKLADVAASGWFSTKKGEYPVVQEDQPGIQVLIILDSEASPGKFFVTSAFFEELEGKSRRVPGRFICYLNHYENFPEALSVDCCAYIHPPNDYRLCKQV